MHTGLTYGALCAGILASPAATSPLAALSNSKASLGASQFARDVLSKRDATELICGFYATADTNDILPMDLPDEDVAVKGGSCRRVGCYDTR